MYTPHDFPAGRHQRPLAPGHDAQPPFPPGADGSSRHPNQRPRPSVWGPAPGTPQMRPRQPYVVQRPQGARVEENPYGRFWAVSIVPQLRQPKRQYAHVQATEIHKFPRRVKFNSGETDVRLRVPPECNAPPLKPAIVKENLRLSDCSIEFMKTEWERKPHTGPEKRPHGIFSMIRNWYGRWKIANEKARQAREDAENARWDM